MSEAIVILGGRIVYEAGSNMGERRLSGALGRRVRAASELYKSRRIMVIASGGRTWDAEAESDAMAEELRWLGVRDEDIVRERCSLTTKENAAYVRGMLEARQIRRITVVTCDWHLPRALDLFRKTLARGIVIDGKGVPTPKLGTFDRLWLTSRERVSRWLDRQTL